MKKSHARQTIPFLFIIISTVVLLASTPGRAYANSISATPNILDYIFDDAPTGSPDCVRSWYAGCPLGIIGPLIQVSHDIYSGEFKSETRSILEFYRLLLGINKPLSSATLQFTARTSYTSFSPPPATIPIGVYGYLGDGTASLTDFSIGSLITTVDVAANTLGNTITVDINVLDFLNSLSGPPLWVGFNLRNESSDTFSNSLITPLSLPTLTITTIPLPPALWLFGSGLLGLVGISRRKLLGK